MYANLLLYILYESLVPHLTSDFEAAYWSFVCQFMLTFVISNISPFSHQIGRSEIIGFFRSSTLTYLFWEAMY